MSMEYVKKFLPYVVIVFLCIGVMLPLFQNGFYPMHDDEQIARLYDLNASLQAGNFPPRLAPNLGFGYGYPFFNFYPSFAYYVGEVFHLLGFSFIVSTKLMLATGFLLAAIFMYIFTKEFFGKAAGVVAATVYTYSSYHAIDVYVRGAYAEFFAFVFIPLIFFAAYKLSVNFKYRYIVLGALGTAGLILSHNLIALMSFPFLAIWLLYLLISTKEKIRFMLYAFVLFFLGFGISAYFWLPSYLERDYTLINILTSELADYKLHFVCTRQLWQSMWGYGGSIPSCYDGISFEIGKIPLILSITAFMLAGYYFIKKKKQRIHVVPIFIFSVLLLLSAFLMIKYSAFVWAIIPPLWYVQFPWRFLLISSFVVAFLSGSVVWFVTNKKIQALCVGIIIVLIVLSNISLFKPQRQFNAEDEFYTNQEKIRWETSSLAYEYVPRGIKTKQSKIGTTLVDITKEEIASSPATVVSGDISVKTLRNLPQNKQFELQVITPGVFQINTFSFPGWHVYVNGHEVQYTDSNKLKLIQVSMPTVGSNTVEAKFTDTPVRFIGNLVSVISIIILISWAFLARKRTKHGKA